MARHKRGRHRRPERRDTPFATPTPESRPARVIVFQNLNVMVFGADGAQAAPFQGQYAEVRARGVLATFVPEERWEWAYWPGVPGGNAAAAWVAGRAAQIARDFPLHAPTAPLLAELENAAGARVIGPNPLD